MKDFKTFSDFMNQINEIFLVTPPPKRKTSTRSASKSKMRKPDPKDPNYVEKMRKWAKQQQEETSVSEDINARLARRAKEIEQYRQERAARREERRKKEERRNREMETGIPFYDKHGKGYIKGGVKTYTQRN